jgi:hypothetical protein
MNQENNTSFSLQKSTLRSYREKKDRNYQNNEQDMGVPSRNSYVMNPSVKTQQASRENPESRLNNIHEEEDGRANHAGSSIDLPDKPRSKSRKIGFSTSFLMIVLAVTFDVIQVLFNLAPVIGNILSVILINTFAWVSFYVWFKILGVDFSKPSRMGTMVGSGFIEMIPIVNVLPTWTLAVVILIASTNVKEAILK